MYFRGVTWVVRQKLVDVNSFPQWWPLCSEVLCGALFVHCCFPLHIVESAAISHLHYVKRPVECLFVSIFLQESSFFNSTSAASYLHQISTLVIIL